MKELRDIVAAYEAARARGLDMALATVVMVEGSSYRRAGARMLVTEDGQLTGAISGGCLEGDALRKAQLAMRERRNKLVTYDTTDEDDARIGTQLGCNGIVHILLEPVDASSPVNPVALLQQVIAVRQDHVLVTMFNPDVRHGHQPGTCLLLSGQAHTAAAFSDPALFQTVYGDTAMALREQQSTVARYGGLTAFLELIPPAISLVIAGAGNDVLPLVDMAYLLGWETTVADGRGTHATRQRFPRATRITVCRPEHILADIVPDHRTVYVLMTHNYQYDLAALRVLVQLDAPYIGVLGPRSKLDRMLEDLAAAGGQARENVLRHLYGPVGLDIGAETAAEIAVSIVAEIRAVLSSREAGFLKDRTMPIHAQECRLTHCQAGERGDHR